MSRQIFRCGKELTKCRVRGYVLLAQSMCTVITAAVRELHTGNECRHIPPLANKSQLQYSSSLIKFISDSVTDLVVTRSTVSIVEGAR
jgi:hypothetical protein